VKKQFKTKKEKESTAGHTLYDPGTLTLTPQYIRPTASYDSGVATPSARACGRDGGQAFGYVCKIT
jgi:hypothetical protein